MNEPIEYASASLDEMRSFPLASIVVSFVLTIAAFVIGVQFRRGAFDGMKHGNSWIFWMFGALCMSVVSVIGSWIGLRSGRYVSGTIAMLFAVVATILSFTSPLPRNVMLP